ncbi:MAG: helix-turn-helix transcriptional regulator [Tannerellaceae bacterium]|nr:helix-turn-helix transcriptional regulator [Tannerellaceae bacterium]
MQKNAKELAELASYTETAFNKKFKKVFGTTPYKWLNERKSTKIMYEITNTDKPLKQIAEEYDFNSQQQFNDYCIRNLKQTPGNIRNSG